MLLAAATSPNSAGVKTRARIASVASPVESGPPISGRAPQDSRDRLLAQRGSSLAGFRIDVAHWRCSVVVGRTASHLGHDGDPGIVR